MNVGSWSTTNALCGSYLIENGLVRTQEAPLDIAFAKANVEHLAICDWIGVVTIRTTFTGKVEVGRNISELLTEHQDQE